MGNSLTRSLWKTSRWFLLLFILMLVLRLVYGYYYSGSGYESDLGGNFFSSLDNIRKNYASEKIAWGNNLQTAATAASSQKYEKTASVRIKSESFDEEEKRMKVTAQSFHAVIQYEQQLGNKGNRQVHLIMGVNPNLFDSFYVAINKLGQIKSTEIIKVDKTNEYQQLNAKKASLEKNLQSLNELKSKGGAISDYVELHDKILDIETRLQELGVELGNFDAENEFCTVKVSLYEGATEKQISFFQRLKVALEWTIKYFALLVAIVFTVTAISFLLLLIIEKLKLFKSLIDKG